MPSKKAFVEVLQSVAIGLCFCAVIIGIVVLSAKTRAPKVIPPTAIAASNEAVISQAAATTPTQTPVALPSNVEETFKCAAKTVGQLKSVTPTREFMQEVVGGQAWYWYALNYLPPGKDTVCLTVPEGAYMGYKASPTSDWQSAETGQTVVAWHATLVPTFGSKADPETMAWGPAGMAPQTLTDLKPNLINANDDDWVGPLYHTKGLNNVVIGWISLNGLRLIEGNCVDYDSRFNEIPVEKSKVVEEGRVLILEDTEVQFTSAVYWTLCRKS